MTRKVVINACFGGFGLSQLAYEYLGLEWDGYGNDSMFNDKRDDTKLVTCVEGLGSKANGKYAKLKIVEIPLDVQWHIEEYDGFEHVAENHRTWN